MLTDTRTQTHIPKIKEKRQLIEVCNERVAPTINGVENIDIRHESKRLVRCPEDVELLHRIKNSEHDRKRDDRAERRKDLHHATSDRMQKSISDGRDLQQQGPYIDENQENLKRSQRKFLKIL